MVQVIIEDDDKSDSFSENCVGGGNTNEMKRDPGISNSKFEKGSTSIFTVGGVPYEIPGN